MSESKSNMYKGKSRISFLKRKTKRSEENRKNSLLSDLLNNKSDSENSDKSISHSASNHSGINIHKTLPINTPPGGILKIYSDPETKEQIYIFKNSIDFCPIGKGVLRIIHGSVNIFGYEISADIDLDDYTFDISDIYPLYTCYNKGSTVKNSEEILKNCNKFIFKGDNLSSTNILKNNQIIKFISTSKDKISIIYFKELSQQFKIISDKELTDGNYEYIDMHKYELYIKGGYDHKRREVIEKQLPIDDKKLLICGKKNSGKSTFLLFLINTVLSNIKVTIRRVSTRTTHPFLFFIDCDSGQPLLSSPFTISFMKINSPIFQNYYNESSASKERKEMIRTILVEENTPSHNFEDYLSGVRNLRDTFERIPNNKSHYLIVNTNGYTSGLGNVINSGILDIIKPHVTFFVKNMKAGRMEKGEEFENYIVNEEEKNSLQIILRKYKLETYQGDNAYKRNAITNLEVKRVVIKNDFELREEENLERKNLNKNLYVYANLLGEEFSLTEGKGNKSHFKNYTLNDILYSNRHDLPLVEVNFDDLTFSFNFAEFKPTSDLDIFLALNSKMCFLLSASELSSFKCEPSSEFEGNVNLKLLNFQNIPITDRKFFSFTFIYNIDIIKRKIILLSKRLSEENKKKHHYILFRNISALDKSIQTTRESNNNLESIIMHKSIFPSSYNLFSEKSKQSMPNSSPTKPEYNYLTRNKYSII